MPRLRHLLLLSFFITALSAIPSFAANPITGTVTNKTTGKPAAGDDVTLIQLRQGMQESTRTKTDARGRFKLAVPDDGIHLVRVTHDKANYFRPAPPGTDSVEVEVFDAAPKIIGVSLGVQELHVEATETELHIVEVLQVLNQSAPARTQFGPAGFDFYIPAEARILRTGAITDGGMPVPATAAPVGDPGHYTFLFPIRPGETQFGIVYSMPYSKSVKLTPRLATNVNTLAIVLPKTMNLNPGPSSPYSLSPENADAQTYLAQNVSPSQPLDFTLSGTGTLPQKNKTASDSAPGTPQPDASGAQSSGSPGDGTPDATKFGGGLGKPLDPDANHDPWAKYKGWILGGLALLLAVVAGVVLRKPATPAVQISTLPHTTAVPSTALRDVLKEELYTLETDRLQKKISEDEYLESRSALERVMQRALTTNARAETDRGTASHHD